MKKTNDILIITSVHHSAALAHDHGITNILSNYPANVSVVFAGLQLGSDQHNLYSAILQGRSFTSSWSDSDKTVVDHLLTALKSLPKHSRVFVNDVDFCMSLPNFTHQKNWLGVAPVDVDSRRDYVMVGASEEGKVVFAKYGSTLENLYAWTGLAYFESVNSVINVLEQTDAYQYDGYDGLGLLFNELSSLLSVILVSDWQHFVKTSQLHRGRLGDPGEYTYEVTETRRVFTFNSEADAITHTTYANDFSRTRCPKLQQFGRYVLQDVQSKDKALDKSTSLELVEFFRFLKRTAWKEIDVDPNCGLLLASLPITQAREGVDYYRNNFDHMDITEVNRLPAPKDLSKFFEFAAQKIKQTMHVCKAHGNLRLDSLGVSNGSIFMRDVSLHNTIDGYGNLYEEIARLMLSTGVDLEKLQRYENCYYAERADGVVEFALPLHSRTLNLVPIFGSLLDNQVVLSLHVILKILTMIKGQPEPVARLLWCFALTDISMFLQRPEFMYS